MFRLIPLKSSSRQLVRFSLCSTTSARNGSHAPAAHGFDRQLAYPKIGKREIVGFGINGQPQYFDFEDVPAPSIRWAEETAEIAAIRNKEKGEWKNLTIDEKKALYRASFRSTYSEMVNSSNGEWKLILGLVLGATGLALWLYQFLFKNYIYTNPKPETMSVEHQTRVLERMIREGVGRVEHASSKWDYEKGEWKK